MSDKAMSKKLLTTLAEIATITGLLFAIVTFVYSIAQSRATAALFEQVQVVSDLTQRVADMEKENSSLKTSLESHRHKREAFEASFGKSVSRDLNSFLASSSNSRVAMYEYLRLQCDANEDPVAEKSCTARLNSFLQCVAEKERIEDGIDQKGDAIIRVVELDSLQLDECLNGWD